MNDIFRYAPSFDALALRFIHFSYQTATAESRRHLFAAPLGEESDFDSTNSEKITSRARTTVLGVGMHANSIV